MLTTDTSTYAAVINHASLCKHDAYCRCGEWKIQFPVATILVICNKNLCKLFAVSTYEQVSPSGASYILRAIYRPLQRQRLALHPLFCFLIQKLQCLCRKKAPTQGRKRVQCGCVNRKFSSDAISLQVHELEECVLNKQRCLFARLLWGERLYRLPQ